MGDEVTVGARGDRRAATVTSVARADRGAVTAEAAMVIPVLVGITIGLVWLVSLVVTQVRVVDAARETARLAARGETDGSAARQGARIAPAGTTFTVSRGSGRIRVTAAAVVTGPGGFFGFLPGVTVRAEAVAAEEPE
jgi:Flp pilus assembly protein TadG